MVNAVDAEGQQAPGELEAVRTLLNTWLIPNDSRQPTDQFAEHAARQGWSRAHEASVRRLRDELRGAVESGDAACLNNWISELGLRPEIAGQQVAYRYDGSPAGEVLAFVMAAIMTGTWRRLKACPDCHWVFYDNTRNGSKRWCLMYAGGPEGRACGTIAKVRRYRDRQAAQVAEAVS